MAEYAHAGHAGFSVIEVIHRRIAGAVHGQCRRIARLHDGRYSQQAQLDERHIGCEGIDIGRRDQQLLSRI